MTKQIEEAMTRLDELHNKHGVQQKGGKKYTMVVHRIQALREVYEHNLGFDTEIIKDDGKTIQVKCKLFDKDGFQVSSGLAEEVRGDGYINKTSCLENCETSALGRALAGFGLGGDQYASIEEIKIAQNKEKQQELDKEQFDRAKTELLKKYDGAIKWVNSIASEEDLNEDNQAKRKGTRELARRLKQLELNKESENLTKELDAIIRVLKNVENEENQE